MGEKLALRVPKPVMLGVRVRLRVELGEAEGLQEAVSGGEGVLVVVFEAVLGRVACKVVVKVAAAHGQSTFYSNETKLIIFSLKIKPLTQLRSATYTAAMVCPAEGEREWVAERETVAPRLTVCDDENEQVRLIVREREGGMVHECEMVCRREAVAVGVRPASTISIGRNGVFAQKIQAQLSLKNNGEAEQCSWSGNHFYLGRST